MVLTSFDLTSSIYLFMSSEIIWLLSKSSSTCILQFLSRISFFKNSNDFCFNKSEAEFRYFGFSYSISDNKDSSSGF